MDGPRVGASGAATRASRREDDRERPPRGVPRSVTALVDRTLETASRLRSAAAPGLALAQALGDPEVREGWARALAELSVFEGHEVARTLAWRSLQTRGSPLAPGELDMATAGVAAGLREAVYGAVVDRAIDRVREAARAAVARFEAMSMEDAREVVASLAATRAAAPELAVVGALMGLGLEERAAERWAAAGAWGRFEREQLAGEVSLGARSRAAGLRAGLLAPLERGGLRRYETVETFRPAVAAAARAHGYPGFRSGAPIGDSFGAVAFREAVQQDRREAESALVAVRGVAALAAMALFLPASPVLLGVTFSALLSAGEQGSAELQRRQRIAMVEEAVALDLGTPGLAEGLRRERLAAWGSVAVSAALGAAPSGLGAPVELLAGDALGAAGRGLRGSGPWSEERRRRREDDGPRPTATLRPPAARRLEAEAPPLILR